ncbi:MAG: radical SAM protein [Bacteroidales bacterium]|nr:radical SAM protein [Bacteroidales bacterium]
MIEIISIDLSNYCSKQCRFCYNHSTKAGSTSWTPDEVICFALDCIENGVKAISLGGGEPFEYDGIFDVIDALQPKAYVSVTSNGLPLNDRRIWSRLMDSSPDKIHITLHNADDADEIRHVADCINRLSATGIKPGVNILERKSNADACRAGYGHLSELLSPDQVILVPQRFSDTPSPRQLASVACGKPFQSPSCLLGCSPPENFCSVSWDKKVNFCSFATGKSKLRTLDYRGLLEALRNVMWEGCGG